MMLSQNLNQQDLFLMVSPRLLIGLVTRPMLLTGGNSSSTSSV